MNGNNDNKNVLITGASRGLGRALAESFYVKRYNLVLNDAESFTFNHNQASGKNIDVVIGNIMEPATIEKLSAIIYEKHKRIDIIINNAGIIYIQPFEQNTEEELRNVFGTNLIAPILLTQRFYPLMQKQKSGHIVNILSTAARYGKPNHTMYCASKFGLAGFTQSLRQEAKQYNIKVSAIYPGGMKTDLYKGLSTKIDTSRFMHPEDVARTILALIEAKDVLGEEIVINNM